MQITRSYLYVLLVSTAATGGAVGGRVDEDEEAGEDAEEAAGLLASTAATGGAVGGRVDEDEDEAACEDAEEVVKEGEEEAEAARDPAAVGESVAATWLLLNDKSISEVDQDEVSTKKMT